MRKRTLILIGSFLNFHDEGYIAQAFEDLGWCVKRFEASNTISDQILSEIETKKYQFVLTVNRELKDGNFKKILGKIKTVFWLFDLYFGTQREYLLQINPLFNSDFVFSTDGGHQKEFKELGINHFCLRQGIYKSEAYIGRSRKEFENDIIFVGTINSIDPNRDKLIDFLQRTYGKQFKWWGRSGPNEIRGKDLNDLYASTKIVVGDSCYSPNYWSIRIYDVLGRGGFLIFPKIPGLENEFVYDKHFVSYEHGDYQDLKKKIDYYLEHIEERNKIKLEGFKYCRENYNFKSRCQNLIEIIQEL